MRITSRALREGARIPKGYGLTYYDACRKESVCHPVPLNVLIRLTRNVKYWLIRRAVRDYQSDAEIRAYQRGTSEARDMYRVIGWNSHQLWLEKNVGLLLHGTDEELNESLPSWVSKNQ